MRYFVLGFALGLLLAFALPAEAQFGRAGLSIIGADSSVRIAPTSADGTGYLLPPPCPADTSTAPFGSICRDTASGTIKIRDAAGVRAL